jgi:hypothetical protein
MGINWEELLGEAKRETKPATPPTQPPRPPAPPSLPSPPTVSPPTPPEEKAKVSVEELLKPKEEVKVEAKIPEDLLTEEPSTPSKEVWLIFGDKGTGKTTTALSFPGEILVLSFDRKSAIIKHNMFNDDPRIHVFDIVKYMDYTTPESMVASAEKTFNYLNALLDNYTLKYPQPDWIVIDGAQILQQIAEWTMRYRHNLGPFDGIANLNLWKERRMYIRQIHNKALNLAKRGVIYSVPGYEPVVVRFADGTVDVLTLEDLWYMIDAPVQYVPMADGNVAEVKEVNLPIYVPEHITNEDNACAWTRISKVIRHRYEGELVRIITRHGLVDVTPNHSIMVNNRPFNASVLKPGDYVDVTTFRVAPHGFTPFFIGTRDFAWLLGYFVGDGTAYKLEERGKYCVEFPDNEYTEKVLEILKENIHCGYESRRRGPSLHVEGKGIYEFFKKSCYTKAGDKRVPKIILNAPKDIKEAFFEGYMAADGHVDEHALAYNSKSHVLLQGLQLIQMDVLGRDYVLYDHYPHHPLAVHVHIRERAYERPDHGIEEVRRVRRIPYVLKTHGVSYEPYVYDLETESHTFPVGIGQVRAHNSTYVEKDEVVIKGEIVTRKDTPAWIDVLIYETDYVLYTYYDESKKTYHVRVVSSKNDRRVKSGLEIDATNKPFGQHVNWG